MLRCPNCGSVSSEIAFKGPVLIASGVASVDADGRIMSLGPVRATQAIKVGQEMRSVTMLGMCTECKAESPMSAFTVVRLCPITGQVAEVEIALSFGTLYVAASAEQEARAIFSEENARWETPVDLERMGLRV